MHYVEFKVNTIFYGLHFALPYSLDYILYIHVYYKSKLGQYISRGEGIKFVSLTLADFCACYKPVSGFLLAEVLCV